MTTEEYKKIEEVNKILFDFVKLGWDNRFAKKRELMELFDNYRIKNQSFNKLKTIIADE